MFAVVCAAPMATSTDVAIAFAFGVVAFGAYGAYTEGRLPILLVALLFSSLFAVVVVNGRENSKALKALAAIGLLGLSFALHLLYLPAGVCCFFVLMVCKNDILLPPSPPTRPPGRPPATKRD